MFKLSKQQREGEKQEWTADLGAIGTHTCIDQVHHSLNKFQLVLQIKLQIHVTGGWSIDSNFSELICIPALKKKNKPQKKICLCAGVDDVFYAIF